MRVGLHTGAPLLANEGYIGWLDPTPSTIRTNEAAAEIRSILTAEDRAYVVREADDMDEDAIIDLVR